MALQFLTRRIIYFVLWLAALAMTGAIILGLSGCDTTGPEWEQKVAVVERIAVQAAADLNEAKRQKDATIARLEEMQAVAATQPDKVDEQAVAAAKGALEKAGRKVDELAAVATKAAEALTAIKDSPEDTAAVESLTKLIPSPYGELAGLAIGLFGLLRARQRKLQGMAIAQAIERAQTTDGLVNFDDDATKETLTAEMGPGARSLVREALGEKSGIPF